jgi:hypothetical protein
LHYDKIYGQVSFDKHFLKKKKTTVKTVLKKKTSEEIALYTYRISVIGTVWLVV